MAYNNIAYFSSASSNGFSDEEQYIGEVCIANISPRERQMRLIFAVQQFMIALVVLGGMLALNLHPLWRLLLFFMFSASSSSFFQARDKT
jgi:hypothetical protein